MSLTVTISLYSQSGASQVQFRSFNIGHTLSLFVILPSKEQAVDFNEVFAPLLLFVLNVEKKG